MLSSCACRDQTSDESWSGDAYVLEHIMIFLHQGPLFLKVQGLDDVHVCVDAQAWSEFRGVQIPGPQGLA